MFDWIFNSFEKSFKLLELFSVRLGSLICFQWCKWSSGFFNSDHPHSSLLSQASLNCLFRFLWFYIFNCVDAGPASFHWSLRHQNRIGEYGLKYWDKQFIVWLDNEFVIRTNCTNDANDLCFFGLIIFFQNFGLFWGAWHAWKLTKLGTNIVHGGQVLAKPWDWGRPEGLIAAACRYIWSCFLLHLWCLCILFK